MSEPIGGWVVQRRNGDRDEYYQGRGYHGEAEWTADAYLAATYGTEPEAQRVADRLGEGETHDAADARAFSDLMADAAHLAGLPAQF